MVVMSANIVKILKVVFFVFCVFFVPIGEAYRNQSGFHLSVRFVSVPELIKDILNERNQTTVDSKRRNLP